jgi:hypothetical protein
MAQKDEAAAGEEESIVSCEDIYISLSLQQKGRG